MSDQPTWVAALINPYVRTARLVPGLLLVLGPIALGIGASASERPGITALRIATFGIGLPLALTEWVHRRGQRLQVRVWAKWGGNPVEAMLREEGRIARRRRDALAAATGLPVLDPQHQDFEEAISNAVRQLITATRDAAQYPLVFAENKNYGFARNLFALRPTGIWISALSVAIGIALLAASTRLEELSTLGTTLGCMVAVGAVVFWLFYPSEKRVRATANDYRDRLLEALDSSALGT